MPKGSAESGPFRPERTPYLLPVYQEINSTKYRDITVVMASQMGKTEFCLNLVGFCVDSQNMPVLFVEPSQTLAEDISKDRFMKMVRGSQSLLSKMAGGRLNQVTTKWIGGNMVKFAWASSATQLCSYPVGLVILDERDRMSDNVENEGDPKELASTRTTNFPNGKVVCVSTPTILGASAIWALFEQGTKHRFHIPCPHCNNLILPCLENFAWLEEKGIVQDAWIKCPFCKNAIKEKHRNFVNNNGSYIVGDPIAKSASFWISGLCSPWRNYIDTAQRWVSAIRSNDPEKIKSCVNTVFGECYSIKGDAVSLDYLDELKQHYDIGTVPEPGQVLTMGADPSGDGIYYAIRAWGQKEQSWLVSYGYIIGNTEDPQVWIKLDGIMRSLYSSKKVSLACIDSGYRSPYVYNFCRESRGVARPCKGVKQETPIRAHGIEMRLKGQKYEAGGTLYHISDHYFKSLLFARMRFKDWFIPEKTDAEYLRQVVAEEQVVTKKGIVWKKNYKNHYLDCEKLNLVAAKILRLDLIGQQVDQTRVLSEGYKIW